MIAQCYKENIYDQTGIAGMIYNGSYYYYEKNILGDVVAVLDINNNEVASYTYDAWGNVISQSGSMADKNPFRYRSYYYDTETGFYYLQSRYYDPSIRRFINADDHSIIGILSQSAGEVNLYAYCGNNPVMYTDESGYFALTTMLISMGIGALIGGVISGVFAIGLEIDSKGWNPNDWDWGSIGLRALSGAVSGAISSISFGAGIVKLSTGTAFSGIGSIVGGLITGSATDLNSYLNLFILGVGSSLISYGINSAFASLKVAKIMNYNSKSRSLAVQKLQVASGKMSSSVLKGASRNLFKATSKKEIYELVINSGPFKYNVYSATIGSLLTGWM